MGCERTLIVLSQPLSSKRWNGWKLTSRGMVQLKSEILWFCAKWKLGQNAEAAKRVREPKDRRAPSAQNRHAQFVFRLGIQAHNRALAMGQNLLADGPFLLWAAVGAGHGPGQLVAQPIDVDKGVHRARLTGRRA